MCPASGPSGNELLPDVDVSRMARLAPPRSGIAFVSHSAALYGAERVLAVTLGTLDRTRFTPILFAPTAGPLTELAKGLDIVFHAYESRYQFGRHRPGQWLSTNSWIWQGFPERVKQLETSFAAAGVSLVYTNTVIPIESAFAAARAGLPHVWHVHERILDRAFFDWAFGTPALARLLGALSDVVVTVSDRCHKELSSFIPAGKLVRIHEPVDCAAHATEFPVPADLVSDREEKRMIFVCVGTINGRKAQVDLLDALAMLPAAALRGCAVWFAGAGADPSYTRRFQQRIASLADGGALAVRWLGHRDDVPAILRSADVLVHPARSDPFPLAVLEAMAAGLPVIAAGAGGIAECIEDGVNGWLVPPRDPRQLAKALAQALACNRDRLGCMGEKAREAVRRYDVPIYAEQANAVIRAALAAERDATCRNAVAQDYQRRGMSLANAPTAMRLLPLPSSLQRAGFRLQQLAGRKSNE